MIETNRYAIRSHGEHIGDDRRCGKAVDREACFTDTNKKQIGHRMGELFSRTNAPAVIAETRWTSRVRFE